jgi:hypothetical protein
MYPQTPPRPAGPPRPPQPYQWLAAGTAGIAGGYVVSSLVAGQLVFLLSGRSGRAEQGLLISAQLIFGIGVVAAAYLLAPGRLPIRLAGLGLFVVAVVATTAVTTLRMSGAFRGAPISPYLLTYVVNPTALLLVAGAVGWLLAAAARPVAYLTLLPTVVVFAVVPMLIRLDLPSPLVTSATLGLSLVIAVAVLIASKPTRP